jgi:hypothetical protein
LDEEVGRRAVALVAAAWLLAGCSSVLSGTGEPPAKRAPAEPDVVLTRPLVREDGGRPDWCLASNLIAFDRGSRAGVSEVFTIEPDGKHERCLTCSARGLPKGLRGQPSWHPSCAWLVIQVSNRLNRGGRYEQLAWGIHHDLWAVAADGSWAEPLVSSGPLGASLDPHVSRDGTRLVWSVRSPTGRKIPQTAGRRTPGGEDPWQGWHLALAKLEIGRNGHPRLAARIEPVPGIPPGGFREADALVGDTLWFSQGLPGAPTVDDVYRMREGGEAVNLTRSPGIWDQHAVPSPGGQFVAFVSSAPFAWRHPPDLVNTLRLELFALGPGGRRIQLSRLNEQVLGESGGRAVAGEHAWGPDARALALAYAIFSPDGSVSQHIDLVELSGFR